MARMGYSWNPGLAWWPIAGTAQANLSTVLSIHFPNSGGRKENIMAKDEQKRCAHLSCKCVVTSDEKYCSQLCKEAGADEVEIACDCGHPACAE